MKKLAALLLTLVSGTAFAVEANVLKCQGQDIVIGMTTSSWTGRPTLSLGRAEVDSSVALTQVELTNTQMGNVVTGFFPHIADASLTYTLIVPDVKITDKDISGIQGMVVKSFVPTFFGSDSPKPGPRQTNDFIPVVCEATLVKF
jgi:hypothetical protein